MQMEDQFAETAIVVGIRKGRDTRSDAEESLSELAALTRAAGAEVKGRVLCDVGRISAGTFVGKGKALDIRDTTRTANADLIVFDEPLSPAQQRNLETICETRILDRTGIILDIFARRARSREGKIQVELAQLTYILPRLTRMWTHLSRLGAGIGTRGPGETQLEVDRRKIRQKLDKLKVELEKISNRRRIQRRGRKRSGLTSIALVGYTNAGKSTLLNRLTGASVDVKNQYFSTLDPTIRLLQLPSNRKVSISDTVGFISRLPHQLVAAFYATLEEVVEADLILQIINSASETRDRQISEVNRVLIDLKCADKPMIYVWNKIDVGNDLKPGILPDSGAVRSVAVSAKDGQGINALIDILDEFETARTRENIYIIPYENSSLLAAIQKSGQILDIEYRERFIRVKARIGTELAGRLKRYCCEEHD